MSGQRRYPAIYAGLAGALGAAIPQTALATSSARDLEGLASGILLPLFFGTLVGAGIVGIAALVTSGEEEYEEDDFSWPSCFEHPVRVQRESYVDSSQEMLPPLTNGNVQQGHPSNVFGHINPQGVTELRTEASGHLNPLDQHQSAATRMRGVAAVLSERISGDPLGEGVVLSRSREIAGARAASRWEGVAAPAQSYRPSQLPSRSFTPSDVRRSQSIAERIARVDENDPFEHAFADGAESFEDLWNSALMALDERIIEQPLSFSDAVGDSETLDEPDGLEVDTDFIPFRAPAGHPEVVDTESYVDYLVRQEFALNAARNAAHLSRDGHPRFLRLVEGGSHAVSATPVAQSAPRRLILSPAERKLAYRPRHLKPEFMVQEA